MPFGFGGRGREKKVAAEAEEEYTLKKGVQVKLTNEPWDVVGVNYKTINLSE